MHILVQLNMIGHQLFASEPIGNLFYLHEVIFEIPKYSFLSKPPAWRGAGASMEIYELLVPFSIKSPKHHVEWCHGKVAL